MSLEKFINLSLLFCIMFSVVVFYCKSSVPIIFRDNLNMLAFPRDLFLFLYMTLNNLNFLQLTFFFLVKRSNYQTLPHLSTEMTDVNLKSIRNTIPAFFI